MFSRNAASKMSSCLSRRSYTSVVDPQGPLVTLHGSSSFFARGIKAVYQTSDIRAKQALIREGIDLYLCNKIVLFDSSEDEACYRYQHSDLYDESTMKHTDSYTWAKQAGLEKAWKYPVRPEKHMFMDAVPNHRELGVPQDVHIVHALAHVEQNAVEIYMDTILRFACHPDNIPDSKGNLDNNGNPEVWDNSKVNRNLPIAFVHDIQRVIQDEARHFNLCEDVFLSLSKKYDTQYFYGSLPLVNNQVQYSQSTRHCLAERLSVISQSQEARGLDATPRFVERLISLNSPDAAKLVDTIGTEEEAHVAFGIKWLTFFAYQNGLISRPVLETQPIPADMVLTEAEKPDFRGEADVLQDKSVIVNNICTQPKEHGAVAQQYQQYVARHYPEGQFPPFNRLARYLAGMPEQFYVPLASEHIQPNRWYFSIPSSSKADAPIRSRYAKYVEKKE